MEFTLSAEDEAFRARLCAWLQENVPAERRPWRTEAERVAFLRAWQRKLYDAGYIAPAWPKEFGGMGATVVQQAIYNEEMRKHGAPGLVNLDGLNIVGPTLIHWGTDEQRARFLKKILTGEHIWAQGFSEPDAGSDLASLKTRAELDGDELVVNGTKIWSSAARYADWLFMLARTDLEAPKHHGISFLLVDMKSPGISVHPIRQISGEAGFSQIFFDNVRVPLANVVGGLNNGWRVAMTSLNHERSGLAGTMALEDTLGALVRLARKTQTPSGSRYDEPGIRRRLAQFAIEIEALRQMGYRTLLLQSRGQPVGPEASVGKLLSSELQKRMYEFALEILGPYAPLTDGPYVVNKGNAVYGFLRSRAATIGGGTSEIQRNVIAERILGLPRD